MKFAVLNLVFFVSGLMIGPALWAEDLVFAAKTKGEKNQVPAILFLPGKMGLSSFIKRQAEIWSEKGYLVQVVDFYQGQNPLSESEGNRLWDRLNSETAMKLIEVSSNRLLKQQNLDRSRVGLVSWQSSGGLLIRELGKSSAFRVGVLLEPTPILDRSLLSPIKARLFCLWGGEDNKEGTRLKFESMLKEEKINFDGLRYPQASVGFMDFTSAKTFNAKVASEANAKLDLFLQRFLSLEDPIKF